MTQKTLSFYFLIIFSTLLLIAPAREANAISESYLKNAGFKIVPCPSFAGHLRKGLTTSISPKTTLCLKGTNRSFKKIAKYVNKATFPFANGVRTGSVFNPINNEEGDVQTGTFEVANFPALIHYKFNTVNQDANFDITAVNAENLRDTFTLVRLEGTAEGTIALNSPGKYYLKVEAYGLKVSDPQPTFSVSASLVSPYSGQAVSQKKAQAQGVKFKKCPAYALDTRSVNIYTLGNKYVCSDSGADKQRKAGFTIAPFNMTKAFFLEQSLHVKSSGDSLWLPFRIDRPVLLNYKVNDPSNGNGRTHIYLYDLNTDKISSFLVSVEGDISDTSTSINIPGDYYIVVRTTPYNQSKLGEISWEYSLNTQ